MDVTIIEDNSIVLLVTFGSLDSFGVDDTIDINDAI
jgi:hypothetical protein